MDRRKFISTLIGGVAASAAVRTFPFRVFCFPSEIHAGNWEGLHLDPYPGPLRTPQLYLMDYAYNEMDGVSLYAMPVDGPAIFLESLSREEAKTRYGYEVFYGIHGRAPLVTSKILTGSTSPPRFLSPTAPNCSEE
jgi:hypothetical protein